MPMDSAAGRFISSPELLCLIAEHLEPIDISSLRGVSRAAEYNSRATFSTKYFSTECVAYTAPGLQRLLTIAQSDRFSGALRALEFVHLNVPYSSRDLRLDLRMLKYKLSLSHPPYTEYTTLGRLIKYRVIPQQYQDPGDEILEQVFQHAAETIVPYTAFLQEQEAWLRTHGDEPLLQSLCHHLARNGNTYRVAFKTVRDSQGRLQLFYTADGERISDIGFGVARVKTSLLYRLLYEHCDFHDTRFRKPSEEVLVSVLQAVSKFGIKLEALQAPNCVVTSVSNMLKDFAPAASDALGNFDRTGYWFLVVKTLDQ